jgi:hypothetical protein
MNRNTLTLLAGTMLGAMMVGGIAAQAQVTNVQPPAVSTNTPGTRPVMRDRTDFLAQRLNLTPEQKVKVKPILDEESQKYAELRKQTALKPEERRAKYNTIRDETMAKLKEVLTGQQYERYARPFQVRTNAPAVRMTNSAPAVPAPAAPSK